MLATASTESAPDIAAPQPTTRTFPWRWLIRIGALALLVYLGWQVYRIVFAGNFETVIPGKLYRGAQPSPQALEAIIQQHKIRTVLNVRGCCWPDEWYIGEAAVCERLGVNLEDVCFSAVHLPSRHELRALIDVLERAEQPIFVHCRQGADRTGIASMSAQLLLGGQSYEAASRQLSIRYGHMPIGKTTMIDRFMQLYADWLTQTRQQHEPKHFRHWALNEYNGGWCDARIEKVEPLFEVPRIRQGLEYQVTVRNPTDTVWRFRPLKHAGHHVAFKLINQQQQVVYEGRAGMFDAEVAPGDAITVIVRVPPQASTGFYRLQLDMIEEGHCWFHQTGSELWEQELVIRE